MSNSSQMQGIKDKSRVKEHGEVFTPDSIVNDMLNLVDEALGKDGVTINETPEDYISKTYLEPACGNGNFLIRILDRKLDAVRKLPKEQQDIALLKAVSTIYGIDIQSDNVRESKQRMLELIENGSVDILELKNKEKLPFSGDGFNLSQQLKSSIKAVLDNNIIHGNALDGMYWDSNGKNNTGDESTDKEIIIIEYKFNDNNVELEAHTLNSMQDSHLSGSLGKSGPLFYYNMPELIDDLKLKIDDDSVDF